MVCKKCGSENVIVQREQIGAKTKTNTKKKGCLFRITRTFLVWITNGFWLLFGKKDKTSKSKTKTQNRTVAVCQDCGYSWTVKRH